MWLKSRREKLVLLLIGFNFILLFLQIHQLLLSKVDKKKENEDINKRALFHNSGEIVSTPFEVSDGLLLSDDMISMAATSEYNETYNQKSGNLSSNIHISSISNAKVHAQDVQKLFQHKIIQPDDMSENSNDKNGTYDIIQGDSQNDHAIETPINNDDSSKSFDSSLSKFSLWSENVYCVYHTFKFIQYSLWALSKIFSSPGLRSMSVQISMTRYVMRFFGIPLSLDAIRNGSWSRGWTDKRIHELTGVMAWSILFYYFFEHIAFIEWVSPKMIMVNAELHSAYSCRFWGLYLMADLGTAVFKLEELNKRRIKVLVQSKNIENSINNASEEILSISGLVEYNRLHAARCILLFLPCIQWSFSKWESDPWLKEEIVNSLMLLESAVCLRQQIKCLSL